MASDITIIGGIIALFIVLGVALPYISAEYGATDNVHTTDIKGAVEGNARNDTSTISIFKIFTSVLSMFFWTFGALPIYLDLFFLIIRIILFMTIARNVWVGGGA